MLAFEDEYFTRIGFTSLSVLSRSTLCQGYDSLIFDDSPDSNHGFPDTMIAAAPPLTSFYQDLDEEFSI